jgi:DNA-binding response OmpR family regulator
MEKRRWEECMNAEDNKTEILVVEDSPTQAEKLRHILEEKGFHVSVADNGKEALVILGKTKPKVVISDVLMPEMDGYELCKRIRSDKNFKEIPIILLTSLSDPRDVIKGLESGANNFIVKPYDERYLVSRVDYLLANLEIRKNSKASMGINVFFAGENYFITAERLQILDLLLSTYENAYHQNLELIEARNELRELNEQLEEKVEERTSELRQEIEQRKRVEEALQEREKELQKRVKELEDFYDIAIGRELRMIDLKNEIEELKKELVKYKQQ